MIYTGKARKGQTSESWSLTILSDGLSRPDRFITYKSFRQAALAERQAEDEGLTAFILAD